MTKKSSGFNPGRYKLPRISYWLCQLCGKQMRVPFKYCQRCQRVVDLARSRR